MKLTVLFLMMGLLLFGCTSEPDAFQVDLVITFNNSDGENIIDDINYVDNTLQYYIADKSGPIPNFKECKSLFLIPLAYPEPIYIDFGNEDVDTLTYKWSGGDSSFPQIMDLDWLEVYYNNNLARKWEFANDEERHDLIHRNCNVKTCKTDCSSPDVIEIIKD